MIDLTCATAVSLIYDRSEEHLLRTIRVLRYMRSLATFGHAILFSACEIKEEVPAEVIQIPVTDLDGLQVFQVKTLYHFIRTPFMLLFHDDGTIIEPERWKPEFLHHDFIGAPWGNGLVGNEGFSIQSQKMLWAKSRLPYVQTQASDDYVCRVHRERMLKEGISFAPFGLALEFSTETVGKDQPAFGYHGSSANPDKHKIAWEKIAAFENPTTPQ